MCAKCAQQTAELLRAMLAAAVLDPSIIPGKQELGAQILSDVNDFAEIIGPAIGEDMNDERATKLSELSMKLGLSRIVNVVKMCGTLSLVLDEINQHGVAAIRGYANAGDLRAAIWMASNADELGLIPEGVNAAAITFGPDGMNVEPQKGPVQPVTPLDLRGRPNLN